MEFLKNINKRTFLNEAVYVVLNIGLALILLTIIQTTNSLWFAYLMVLLSLWRIFAVRPRFWFAHIQANIVNIIVSISYVTLMYAASIGAATDTSVFGVRLFLTVLYIGWLLFLKPQSKRLYMAVQAGAALFLGFTAVFTLSYGWIATPVVLLTWLIGYGTARHILSTYDEENHSELLSWSWGLVSAELGWLAYHWTVAYRLPATAGLMVPQISIIMLCIAFVVFKAYNSIYHNQRIRMNDILMPLVFSVGIILVLLVFFNGALA